MRMRSDPAGGLVIGGLSGRYLGVVDRVTTPLFGVVSAVFSRARPHAGGGYEIIEFEQAYFTDLETGAALKRWRNPFTLETVDVPIASSSARAAVLQRDLKFISKPTAPGVSFTHFVEPPEVFGGDVYFVEQIAAAVPASDGRPAFHYSETSTLRARQAALTTGAGRVPCETTFDAVVSWRPWMKMADRPGHLMAWGHGRYGLSLPDLPPAWRAASRDARPELLSHPEATLDAALRALS